LLKVNFMSSLYLEIPIESDLSYNILLNSPDPLIHCLVPTLLSIYISRYIYYSSISQTPFRLIYNFSFKSWLG